MVLATTALHSFPVGVSSSSDYVHDVTYNYYGTKMAICTTAQKILVWEKREGAIGIEGGDWTLTAEISNAHSGPIWRLDWAHPEFGQILASCSEDRGVSIWSEKRKTPNLKGQSWKKRATLTDSAHAVTDVQFCPRQFGLKLAACTSDGIVRIYQANDPLNLGSWDAEDFSTIDKAHANPIPSQNHGCTAISWCGTGEQERLAVACQSGALKVYERRNRWQYVCERQVNASGEPLKDCAWAPNLCRDNEWLASCGDSSGVDICQFSEIEGRCSLIPLFSIQTGSAPLWRVAWNLTGTILAVAPESGEVQVWRLVGPAATWCRVNET